MRCARFFVMEHEAKQQMLYVCLMQADSPESSQKTVLHNLWIQPHPGSKHDAQNNDVYTVHNISRLRIQPQPAYYFFQTTISFTKFFIRKMTSCDTLMSSRFDFRYDHCK